MQRQQQTQTDARPFQILMSITGMDYKLKITQIESAVQTDRQTEKRLKRGLLSTTTKNSYTTEKHDSILFYSTGSTFSFLGGQ